MEGVDPHMSSEHIGWVLAESVGLLAIHAVESIQEARRPRSAVLYHTDTQRREAFEYSVCDERRERIEDVPALFVDEASKGRELEALELLAAFPIGEIAVVSGVRIMHLHGDARGLDQPPEIVELWERRRPGRAVFTRHRRGTDQHRASPILETPFEFCDSGGRVVERNRRDREDPILIVERPVVQQPPVERVGYGVG